MHFKYEVSRSYGLKVIAIVKVDNRQANRQTEKLINRQDKTINPIIRGIKWHNASFSTPMFFSEDNAQTRR